GRSAARASILRRRAARPTARQLLIRDDSFLEEDALDSIQPMKKVRRSKILERRNSFHRVAELVDVVDASHKEHEVRSQNAAFPILTEYRLVRLEREGPHLLHSTEIVNAVHRHAPSLPSSGLSVGLADARANHRIPRH